MKIKYHAFIRVIGIIIFIIILYKINVLSIIPVLKKSNPVLLSASIVLLFPLMLVKTMRWNSLLKMQMIQYSFTDVFSIYMASFYFGMITPGRIGDFFKMFYLVKEKSVSYGKAFANVLSDRLFDVVVIMIITIMGLLVFGLAGSHIYVTLFLFCSLVIGILIFSHGKMLILVLKTLFRSAVGKPRQKVIFHVNDFIEELQQLRSVKLIIPFLLTIVIYGIIFFQCYFIAQAVGIRLSYFYIAFAVSLAQIIALLPVSYLGIGPRDGILIYVFGLVEISPQKAIGFSLVYLALFFLLTGIWGAVCWFRRPIRFADLKVRTRIRTPTM